MTKSTRQVEATGVLGTYRSDFEAHWKGTSFRQGADTIDANPLIPLPGAPVSLQDTLEAMYTAILNSGDVISIGDGVQSTGTYTIGLGYGSFDECLSAAVANFRLANYGGTILIKSGFYTVTDYTQIPCGISIIGELGGTILNITNPSGVFQFEPCPTIDIASGVAIDGYRESKVMNLTFVDNYGSFIPSLSDTNNSGFFRCKYGSKVSVEHCNFFGKYNGSIMSKFAVKIVTTASTYPTILRISKCNILGVEKVVDFNVDNSKQNKLTIDHNRITACGVIGGTTKTQKSIVSFTGCDTDISHNEVTFGISAPTQVATKFIYCHTIPAALCTLIVIGNKLKFSTTALSDNLIEFVSTVEAETGKYFRSVISGNSTGGTTDGNFCLTVGDGTSTIGDINGTRALEFIYTYFIQDNASTTRTGGCLTIYLKPGIYKVGSSYFSSAATTFNYKLIGLGTTPNLPKIHFDYSGLAAIQDIYLGTHVENIYFYGDSNLYNLKLNTYNVVNPESRPIYFSNIVARNCVFYNCSVEPIATAITTVREKKNYVLIERCQFANSAVLNCTIEEQTSLHLNVSCSSVEINDCLWSNFADFRGAWINSTNAATYYSNDLVITNCVFSSDGIVTADPISISTFRNVTISGCSAEATNVVGVSRTFYVYAKTRYQDATTLVFTNNKLTWEDDDLDYITGLYVDGVTNANIDNNYFSATPVAIFCRLQPNTGSTVQKDYSIKITNNQQIASANTYGFCCVEKASTTNPTKEGFINIENNILYMADKSSSINRDVASTVLYSYGIMYVMGCVASGARVSIINNKVIDYISNYDSATAEAIICSMSAKESVISNNELTFSNVHDNTRTCYGIYTSPDYPPAAYVSNTDRAHIEGNTVSDYNGAVLRSQTNIYVKDTRYVTIVGNKVFSTGTSTNTRFIWTTSDPSDPNFGMITNNLIDSELVLHETSSAVVYYDTAYVGYFLKNRIVCENNKGQLIKKQIDCFNFVQYGYNDKQDGSANDNYPYNFAKILVNEKAGTYGVFEDAHASNNNKSYQMDIITYDASWTALPTGTYISNAFPNGQDPRIYAWYKHQMLIPLNLGNFYRIKEIKIPIYLRNMSGSPYTFEASASLVFGNAVDDHDKIRYITDPTLTSWKKVTTTLTGGTASSVTLTHAPQTTMSNSFDGSPIYGGQNSGAAIGVAQNSYVVLSLSSSASVNTATRIEFAVPYCRVSVVC